MYITGFNQDKSVVQSQNTIEMFSGFDLLSDFMSNMLWIFPINETDDPNYVPRIGITITLLSLKHKLIFKSDTQTCS